jgi:citrate lyase subunit beta/citryl-CoA lyase
VGWPVWSARCSSPGAFRRCGDEGTTQNELWQVDRVVGEKLAPMTTAPLLRSFLYVPGDRADRVAKALRAGADAVLIDLEDSVALSGKEAARLVAVECLRDRSGAGPAVWVRINSGAVGRVDAAALATEAAHLAGVVLAKCDDLNWLDEIASTIPAPTPLSPLVESALGLRRLDALCAHPRVTQCHLGEIDLLAELGAHGDAGPQLLGHAHAELLFASAAAGILPPIGGVYADFRDLDGFAVDSTRLAQLGFGGRPAIHPSQVPVVNAAFRPSADELATAAALVASYDEALARGQGAVTDEGGRMVDEAVVRRARQLLAGQPHGEPRTT